MQTAVRFLTAAALSLSACPSLAQHMFEARGADTSYRYFDWNYTSSRSVMVDVFYVGVPGSNEFNIGGGYGLKPLSGLVVAPLVYAVVGKEGDQRGVKVAVLVTLDRGGWRLNSFLGHFAPITGEVSRYQVLDTLDFTRVYRSTWEFGVSAGFFHSLGAWGPQVGPVLKLNDRLGAWALSWRFGPQNEVRFGRVVVLKK